MKELINIKIMKNQMLIAGTVLLLAAQAAGGAEHPHHAPGSHHDHGDYYRAHELSLDLFGTASLGQYVLDNISGDRVRQDTQFGAGIGLNYFFTRNLGIGVDAYSEDTSGAFVDSASVNFIARFPLAHSGFAPYIEGGGGYQFDWDNVAFVQAGGGIEYRFTREIGAFIDARYVFTDKTENYGVARLGLRFGF